MERRIVIFTDINGKEIGRSEHDTSLISSLPRKDDTILDQVVLYNNAESRKKLTYAIVRNVEFDFSKWMVTIYAEVIRTL